MDASFLHETVPKLEAAHRSVAEALGNTLAVCRKAYVHPVVVNAYLEGSLAAEAGVPADGLARREEVERLGVLGAGRLLLLLPVDRDV